MVGRRWREGVGGEGVVGRAPIAKRRRATLVVLNLRRTITTNVATCTTRAVEPVVAGLYSEHSKLFESILVMRCERKLGTWYES